MMPRLAVALLLLTVPAGALDRSTSIAMAVALLDVAGEYCTITIDSQAKVRLMRDFHEYDIAGLASILSGPLNVLYEDYLHQMKSGRASFCGQAPALSSRTGYPVITAAE